VTDNEGWLVQASLRSCLTWAFITIRHYLLMVALPPRPPSTDRGRQSANQRITGGLVSHDQAKRVLPVGQSSGQTPRVPSTVPSARGLDHRVHQGKPRVEDLEEACLHRGRGVPVDRTHPLAPSAAQEDRRVAAWPISSSITRAGMPSSSSRVAKVWRRSWGPRRSRPSRWPCALAWRSARR
jgi:hypothetical protein